MGTRAAAILIGSILCAAPAAAQYVLGSSSEILTIDLTTANAGGFAPMPSPFQIDSDECAFSGLSTATMAFGGTCTSAPCAGGAVDVTYTDMWTTGGIYSPVEPSAFATLGVWLRPTDADFTPGSLMLRVRNQTGATHDRVVVFPVLAGINDSNGSMRAVVRVRTTGAAVDVPGTSYVSPAAADGRRLELEHEAEADLSATPWVNGSDLIIELDVDEQVRGGAYNDMIGLASVMLFASRCGDNFPGASERCDDGNAVTETRCPYSLPTCVGCTSDCSAVLYLTGPYCGDGLRTDSERCDDGNNITELVCDYGTASCLRCSADCRTLYARVGSICGDSVIDLSEGERCDDGNAIEETACAYGVDTCNGCSADCRTLLTLAGGRCGDGRVDTGFEACDDGNVEDERECLYGTASCDGCSSDCLRASALTGPYCGDGHVDGGHGEECDDANAIAGDGCEACAIVPLAPDAGPMPIDGGARDDAAIAGDAAIPDDAAVHPDAGMAAASAGCGCTVARSTPTLPGILLLFGLVLRRRNGPRARGFALGCS